MGQTQSTQGGRQRELSKADDAVFDFAIPKKIKTAKENEEKPEENLIKVSDDGGSGYITDDCQHGKKKTVPVVFHWEYGGKEVSLAGSFNKWKKVSMAFSGGQFTAIIEMPSGTHEFKYFVDGNWRHDPSQTVSDTFDGRNNVITVSETDFDPTEALLTDETSISNPNTSFDSSVGGHSPPGSYGRMIPHHGLLDVMGSDGHYTAPPSLPPHLLNVILNKETEQDDPTMLPVPNHVALNHLYALSIKDSVMTLSGTHRYKRKYITTVLYKPVVLK